MSERKKLIILWCVLAVVFLLIYGAPHLIRFGYGIVSSYIIDHVFPIAIVLLVALVPTTIVIFLRREIQRYWFRYTLIGVILALVVLLFPSTKPFTSFSCEWLCGPIFDMYLFAILFGVFGLILLIILLIRFRSRK